ncbi:MAG TPA: SH3 domain-containing protein [Methylophilaceae bacterium]|nr:SH3 domain-containing protein [Methylophilaceae bacterium]
MRVPKKFLLTIINAALLATLSSQAFAEEATTPNAQAAAIQLQVLSSTIKVYAEPQADALLLYQIPKGNLLDVVEQKGEWFKIKVNTQQEFGWVKQESGEYGESTLSVVPNKGDVSYAQEQVGATKPEDAPQTKQFQPAKPNTIVTLPPIDSEQVPAPAANLPRDSVPVPDRWRIMQALGFKHPWYDPFNQNHLKGDIPVLKQWGEDLFFNLGIISDTLFESRKVATPVGQQAGNGAGANNIYGDPDQFVFNQNIIISLDIQKGNTTFKPPEYEFKFVPVINYNFADVEEAGVLYANPRKGTTRKDNFVGVQELFADVHLRNVSDRYDFDSIRVGIQPFISDFRGFLFQDTPFGVRLFGNRANNRYQYNLAWFRRMEKDTNSGLNDIGQSLRNDDIYAANLYMQDFPVRGFTSQVSVTHNRNNEKQREYDTNDFLVRPALIGDLRPHAYQVTYLGYTGDGHFGKWSLATSSYLAVGTDDRSPIAQTKQDIFAGFHASELARDFDWIRVRGNLLLASGDKNPYDDKSTGFDAILENPQFAGASTSYYIRQSIPLIGGGGVAISGRNGLLPSLRSSPIQGQSNFVNPGLILFGVGADLDISPQLRVFGNLSDLSFMNTSSLGALRNEAAPPRHMGVDASIGFHWRPLFNQNIIINGSMGALKPGDGLKQLYGDDQGTLYSALINALFTY